MKHKKISKISQITKQNSDLVLEGEYDDADEVVNMVKNDENESKQSDDDCNLFYK
jgi:hypothetical protein